MLMLLATWLFITSYIYSFTFRPLSVCSFCRQLTCQLLFLFHCNKFIERSLFDRLTKNIDDEKEKHFVWFWFNSFYFLSAKIHISNGFKIFNAIDIIKLNQTGKIGRQSSLAFHCIPNAVMYATAWMKCISSNVRIGKAIAMFPMHNRTNCKYCHFRSPERNTNIYLNYYLLFFFNFSQIWNETIKFVTSTIYLNELLFRCKFFLKCRHRSRAKNNNTPEYMQFIKFFTKFSCYSAKVCDIFSEKKDIWNISKTLKISDDDETHAKQIWFNRCDVAQVALSSWKKKWMGLHF